MDDETTRELRSTFRQLLAATPPAEVIRELESSGWRELLVEDRESAVSLLFEEHGRSAARSPALDLATLEALGCAEARDVAVVYPTIEARDRAPGRISGSGQVPIEGVVLPGIERAKTLLVAAEKGEEEAALVSVPANAAGLRRAAVGGLDPELGLVRLQGAVDVEGFEPSPERAWERMIAAARRALAHELVGVGEALVSIAIEHVKQRHQFGRPIGAFQTVKHRLADVHVSLVAARTGLDASWSDDDSFSARVAKALAGRAVSLASRHCAQVCGAMGWTWEQGMHRFIRRGALLDSLLGSSRWIQEELGRELMMTAKVPRVGRL